MWRHKGCCMKCSKGRLCRLFKQTNTFNWDGQTDGLTGKNWRTDKLTEKWTDRLTDKQTMAQKSCLYVSLIMYARQNMFVEWFYHWNSTDKNCAEISTHSTFVHGKSAKHLLSWFYILNISSFCNCQRKYRQRKHSCCTNKTTGAEQTNKQALTVSHLTDAIQWTGQF